MLAEEEDESDLPCDRPVSSRQYYLQLFHLGKNISSIASRDPATAVRVAGLLEKILNEMIETPPSPSPLKQIRLILVCRW